MFRFVFTQRQVNLSGENEGVGSLRSVTWAMIWLVKRNSFEFGFLESEFWNSGSVVDQVCLESSFFQPCFLHTLWSCAPIVRSSPGEEKKKKGWPGSLFAGGKRNLLLQTFDMVYTFVLPPPFLCNFNISY